MTDRTALSRLGTLAMPSLLLALLALPFLSLVLASTPADLAAGLSRPIVLSAIALSARTTIVSLALVVVTGTPLAWWLATSRGKLVRAAETLVDAPIVVPPAVVGIALLTTFGRDGLLWPPLEAVGVSISFTTAAVIIAQVVVSAPFYVQSAAASFRAVDLDLVLVARTLGASRRGAFLRVAVPLAMPGLVSGAALAWARAIGEFGATLLFAGNLPGITQTMPLAIYAALEADVRTAVAMSLVLLAVSLALLLLLRAIPGRRP